MRLLLELKFVMEVQEKDMGIEICYRGTGKKDMRVEEEFVSALRIEGAWWGVARWPKWKWGAGWEVGVVDNESNFLFLCKT